MSRGVCIVCGRSSLIQHRCGRGGHGCLYHGSHRANMRRGAATGRRGGGVAADGPWKDGALVNVDASVVDGCGSLFDVVSADVTTV